MPAFMVVTVRLLGPFEVSVGGSPLVLGRPHPRSLLALLALRANQNVPVHDIVEVDPLQDPGQ